MNAAKKKREAAIEAADEKRHAAWAARDAAIDAAYDARAAAIEAAKKKRDAALEAAGKPFGSDAQTTNECRVDDVRRRFDAVYAAQKAYEAAVADAWVAYDAATEATP